MLTQKKKTKSRFPHLWRHWPGVLLPDVHAVVLKGIAVEPPLLLAAADGAAAADAAGGRVVLGLGPLPCRDQGVARLARASVIRKEGNLARASLEAKVSCEWTKTS